MTTSASGRVAGEKSWRIADAPYDSPNEWPQEGMRPAVGHCDAKPGTSACVWDWPRSPAFHAIDG